jgi:hypothetical protein
MVSKMGLSLFLPAGIRNALNALVPAEGRVAFIPLPLRFPCLRVLRALRGKEKGRRFKANGRTSRRRKGIAWSGRETSSPSTYRRRTTRLGPSTAGGSAGDRSTPNGSRANARPCVGSSRYVGVFRHKDKGAAAIRCRGEYFYLGLHADEVEAAKARDHKAFERHGERVYLNFPEEFRRGFRGYRRPKLPLRLPGPLRSARAAPPASFKAGHRCGTRIREIPRHCTGSAHRCSPRRSARPRARGLGRSGRRSCRPRSSPSPAGRPGRTRRS